MRTLAQPTRPALAYRFFKSNLLFNTFESAGLPDILYNVPVVMMYLQQ
jgi:hypothetical protein